MCKARRAARKNRNLRRPAAIFLFAAAEGGKGFREAFEQTVRSCSDGGNMPYRPGHGSAGLDAQRANRSVQIRCFPAWRHLSEGVLSTIFVMHSAIWIFSRLSEQIKQSFCENLYGACRGTPGLRIVFAWVFRYNKYRCCLHKGYLQKA